MRDTVREFFLAARRLARSPSFSLTTVATVALGLGAATAVFSVVNAVILRPLPYPDADRLVLIGHANRTHDLGVPDGGYFQYSKHSQTLAEMAVYIESTAHIPGTGEPLELGVIQATPSLLRVLEVPLLMGRNFVEEDARRGADPVVIVSHGFWVRRLGSDPDVIGKPVIEGGRQRVIGVLPSDFRFIRPQATVVFGNPFTAPDVMVPLRLDESRARIGNFIYQGVARLAPGASSEDALVELTALLRQGVVNYPGGSNAGGYNLKTLEEEGLRPVVVPLKEAVIGDVSRVLWILAGAVGFVLLIGTVNVVNLFAVRAESMRREMAVRRALGAGRAVLARWFVSEGLVLAALGGLLGAVVGINGTAGLLQLAPPDVPRLDQVSADGSVLMFAVVISLLAGVAFGLVGLIRCRGTNLTAAMRDEGRAATLTRSGRRAGRTLVVAQVAFALILLVGSGLLLTTFRQLQKVDAGFGSQPVLSLRLSLPSGEFPADTDRTRFLLQLTERLEGVPGVTAASFSGDLPLDGNEWSDAVVTKDAIPVADATGRNALRVFMGPGYLETIGARILRGRELERLDFAGDYPRVVVVNESFARQRWPGQDPIGKRLAQWYKGQSPDRDIWHTVVGVVGDIRERSLMREPEPTVYLPTIFLPDSDFVMFVRNLTVVLQTSAPDSLALFERVRKEIRAVHAEIPIDAVQTLAGLKAASMRQVTFAMVILLIATVVSVLLGFVGIYGVVTYFVGQRTREFGVRLAFGATGADLRRNVLTEGCLVAAVGIVLGLGGALVASRGLETMLFGVSAADPWIYSVAAAGLFLLVLAAGLAPAQRAARIDPLDAIRAE